MSGLVDEIAAASQEQSSGIEQVNRAVMDLDEMTQQNAALVEEAASASESLVEQTEHMNRRMAFFTVGEEAMRACAPHPVTRRATLQPVGKALPGTQASSGCDPNDEWEEF
jgi:methyl-accepting chemotaxis protein